MSARSSQSSLFNLLGKHFATIETPLHQYTMIPIHCRGRLNAPHEDYPCFGRGIISNRPDHEKYRDHSILRSPILPAPWFAGVIRIPGDVFQYAPMEKTLLPVMVFICNEGVWIMKLHPSTLEEIKKALAKLSLPQVTHKPPPASLYFEPKALS